MSNIQINVVSAQFISSNYIGVETQTGNLYYNTPDNIVSMVSAININAETLTKACFFINQVSPNTSGNLKIKGQNGIQVLTDLANNSIIIKNTTNNTINNSYITNFNNSSNDLQSNNKKLYKFDSQINNTVFQFQSVTKQSLYELIQQKKLQYCHNGIILIKDGIKYKFQTTQDSITFGNSTMIRLQFQTDDTIVKWKLWRLDNQPTTIEFTKLQFQNLYKFTLNMINSTFEIQGNLNKKITNMTDQQLTSEQKIIQFKEQINKSFESINRQIDFSQLK